MSNPVLAIHGGAGILIAPERHSVLITSRLEALKRIIDEAQQALIRGASALEVVVLAVSALEDDEGFNAGRGAVLNILGEAELDAGVMQGKDRKAGAIACVRHTKNPVQGAKEVMEKSSCVLLVGEGADQFCQKQGLTQVPPDYFVTSFRYQQWKKSHLQGGVDDLDALGTVGAVARDVQGHLAAATSTGGKTNKLAGRVGDSPIIGAGTWADDQSCAISATGDGEMFIRTVFAYNIHTQVKAGVDLKTASEKALLEVSQLKGEGGCIVVGKSGNPELSYNTSGMYRAWIDLEGHIHVAVGKE